MTDTAKLRHRIEFQRRAETPDGMGGVIVQWGTIPDGTRWGKVEPLSGRELFQAMQVQNPITHKITIRSMDGLDPSMRVKFGDRLMRIHSILDLTERGFIFQIMAEEYKEQQE